MKLSGFSFRREATWLVVINFVPLLIGFLVAVVVWFFR